MPLLQLTQSLEEVGERRWTQMKSYTLKNSIIKKTKFEEMWNSMDKHSKIYFWCSIFFILLIAPLTAKICEYFYQITYHQSFYSHFIPFIVNIFFSSIAIILLIHNSVIKPIIRLNNELKVNQVALAETNIKLNDEVEKSIRIHKRLLPQTNIDSNEISISSCYQPANDLGGDFYGIIEVEKKIIVFLSDVSGHGMEGSLISAFIKGTISSYVSLRAGEISPENILLHVEEQYRKENFPDDYFISIFLSVLNLENHEFCYAGAGFQEPILLANADGEQISLYSRGLPISSAIPRNLINFTTKTVNLTKKSTLMLHTDGLTEDTIGFNSFNKEKNRVFFENSHLSPMEIINAVKSEYTNINNKSEFIANDDITILVLQIK